MKSIVLILVIAVCVLGHGGITDPAPLTTACSSASDLAPCGEGGSPCGPGNANMDDPSVVTVNAGDSLDITFYQKIAHFPGSPDLANTYQILFWENGASSGVSLLTQNQTNSNSEVSINFSVDIPEDAATGDGLIEFIYDCTPGGATVYFTCSSVKVTSGSSAAFSMFASAVLIAAAMMLAL